jgi:hypothetical protein
MKKLVLVIAIAAIFITSSIVYGGQFGPPEPAAKEGKAALGIGYFYHSAKFKSDWGESKSTQNQAYLQLGYGLAKNWEAYIRVGGADAKIKEAFEFDNSTPDFKDGLKPGGTIGVKGVFNVSDSFGIGPFLQASISSGYKDTKTGTLTIDDVDGDGLDDTINTESWKIKNPWEVNIGIAIQAKIGETIIYGGPVAYWAKSKVEATFTGTGSTGAAISGSGSTTYKEKNNIGGFAGLRVPLSKSLNLEVEGQMKSRFSFGGALTYSF